MRFTAEEYLPVLSRRESTHRNITGQLFVGISVNYFRGERLQSANGLIRSRQINRNDSNYLMSTLMLNQSIENFAMKIHRDLFSFGSDLCMHKENMPQIAKFLINSELNQLALLSEKAITHC